MKCCWWRVYENYDVITIFQNTFVLRRSRVAMFVEIIEIVTTFIKTIIKYSKLKELEIID